jgi:hypothetical protein
MTPQDIADEIVRNFDRNSSKKVYEAICDVLLSKGYADSEASELAENCENQVFNHLEKQTPTELPFDFSIRGRNIRLIGKSRIRRDDKPETIYARTVSPFISEMRKTMAKMHYDDFETLCAASLRLAGATEAFALRTHDEGGIDFFGRIPLRNQSENIPETLLRTALVKQPLLILGQAKRIDPNSCIGRPEIQKFSQQVRECLAKYPDNPDPPKKRVPSNYYTQNEPCLPIFITTASFSGRVTNADYPNGILLIEGQELAEFILARRIGIIKDKDGLAFSGVLMSQWVRDQIAPCTYNKT